ncbi:MAG: hypothetical protein AB2385_12585 [Symbiobacterium sp.]|uniref:hypothetical protein n=1 Tax=Symbiobacterium sp. TaxID=1971213 RepID=UPI0034647F26
MRLKRATVTGAAVGFALGMPVFEVALLTILLIDGGLFNAMVAIRYFSQPLNLIVLLVVLHVAGALIGAGVGYLAGCVRVHPRARLRVIPGGRR